MINIRHVNGVMGAKYWLPIYLFVLAEETAGIECLTEYPNVLLAPSCRESFAAASFGLGVRRSRAGD